MYENKETIIQTNEHVNKNRAHTQNNKQTKGLSNKHTTTNSIYQPTNQPTNQPNNTNKQTKQTKQTSKPNNQTTNQRNQEQQ